MTMSTFPSSTPAERPYNNLLTSSQYPKNNFVPTKRQFKRTTSPQETEAVLRRDLMRFWKHKEFRFPQLQICKFSLMGCDLLVVAPTGLGKSLCFQLPAITIEHGITIVVSPLLSLMNDQVKSLLERHIDAAMLNQDVPDEQVKEVRRQMRMGHPKLRLLYVTPETLLSRRYRDMFDVAYKQKQIARFVIDEAHTITEWGKTFRPTYRELGKFREWYPGIPVTALTASATKEVRDDIVNVLRIEKGFGQWVMPFNRRNLFYSVRYKGRGADDEDVDPDTNVIDDVGDWIEAYRPQAHRRNVANNVVMPCVTGLVYCRTKKACEEVAEALCNRGISAAAYYKDIRTDLKKARMDKWSTGEIECIVATIAFGMGVDQKHVRYVIHYDMPKSFEGYYQETGRAGRDEHISHCLAYYSREDAQYTRSLVNREVSKQKRFPPDDTEEIGNDDITPRCASLRSFKMLQHCFESTTQCRHVSICRYFGEKIDEKNKQEMLSYCDQMCDVCCNPGEVRSRALRLTEAIPSPSQVEPLSRSSFINLAPAADPEPEPPSSDPSIPNSLMELQEGLPLFTDDLAEEEVAKSKSPRFHPQPPSPLPPPPLVPFEDTPRLAAAGPSRTPRLERDLNSPSGKSDSTSTTPTLNGSAPASIAVAGSSATSAASHTPRLERMTPQSPQSVFKPIRHRPLPPSIERRPPPEISSGPSPPPQPVEVEAGPSKTHRNRPREQHSRLPDFPSPAEAGPSRRRGSREQDHNHQFPPPPAQAEAGSSRKRPRASESDLVTPIRGVRYITDSEEGTASELKLTREQRIKADKMLRSVDPATADNQPYACYNGTGTTPLKYRRISSATGGGGFKPPIIKSPTKVRCEMLTKSTRDNGLITMTEALKASLAHGELARELMRAWHRPEKGSNRLKVLVDIARLIERDIADKERNSPEEYNRRIKEFKNATKALRSDEVVQAISAGDLDTFDDGGAEYKILKKLERCFVNYVHP